MESIQKDRIMGELDNLMSLQHVKNEPYFYRDCIDVLECLSDDVMLKLIAYSGIVHYKFMFMELITHDDFFDDKMLLSTLM